MIAPVWALEPEIASLFNQITKLQGSNSKAARAPCPFWVISGHFVLHASCPLYPRKQTFRGYGLNVRFVPIADMLAATQDVHFTPKRTPPRLVVQEWQIPGRLRLVEQVEQFGGGVHVSGGHAYRAAARTRVKKFRRGHAGTRCFCLTRARTRREWQNRCDRRQLRRA